MRKFIVGSRRSQLALTQTNWVIEKLKQTMIPFEFEIKEIVTKGDQILDVTLSKVGGKGLFVKEIEQALLDGEIDFAVHSMKDMPAVLPKGLVIGAIPKRVDARDVLISKNGLSLAELPEGAVIGTSSLRRGAQLKAFRQDFEIKWIRGNVDTRIRKLAEENYDAIILAAAGLERLAWTGEITERIPYDVCLPAVGQGALAIECREDDTDLLELLSRIHDDDTANAVTAERSFLGTLEGGCQVPIGAYAEVAGDEVELTGLVATEDGTTVLKDKGRGKEAAALGRDVARKLIEKGASEILDRVRQENAR